MQNAHAWSEQVQMVNTHKRLQWCYSFKCCVQNLCKCRLKKVKLSNLFFLCHGSSPNNKAVNQPTFRWPHHCQQSCGCNHNQVREHLEQMRTKQSVQMNKIYSLICLTQALDNFCIIWLESQDILNLQNDNVCNVVGWLDLKNNADINHGSWLAYNQNGIQILYKTLSIT